MYDEPLGRQVYEKYTFYLSVNFDGYLGKKQSCKDFFNIM